MPDLVLLVVNPVDDGVLNEKEITEEEEEQDTIYQEIENEDNDDPRIIDHKGHKTSRL